MKTSLPLTKALLLVILLITAILWTGNITAQSALTNGLNFSNPQLRTANSTNKKAGAVYLFSNVGTGIDATVTIDELANGATLDEVDDNTVGTGYRAAFQPAIRATNI